MAVLLASLLDADWEMLEDEVRAVETAGVDGFSLDIIDGHFVPRVTFGPDAVSAIRNMTDIPLEVHLMVIEPENQVEKFCDAGADQVIFQLEAADDPLAIIGYIKGRGIQAGLSLLIETPLEVITDRMLESIDALNFMAVPVGYGGQKVSDKTIERIQAVRKRAERINPLLAIEIDGGMKPDNCAEYAAAGADAIIIGTGIYKSGDYGTAVRTAKQNMSANDFESRKRMEAFLSGPSGKFAGDADRRRRLEQIRIELGIPQSAWDPLNSRR